MAKINTDRPEAMVYRGQDMAFVRIVTPADGPAFNEMIDQVIVRDSDGRELYFFANEVALSEDEKKAADETAKKAEKDAAEADKRAQANFDGKTKLFDGYKAGANDKKSDEDKAKDRPNQGTGGIAPPDIPAHTGVSGEALQGETSRFNRVPGEPPRTAQTDAPAMRTPGTADHTEGGTQRDVGRSGYPEGSGPDPQGRRVSEQDQSHSGTTERPAPPGGSQGPTP